MIYDKIENLKMYSNIIGNIDEIISFIEKSQTMAAGKYILSSGFVLVQQGHTSNIDEVLFESHRKYVDLQVLIAGDEIIEVANINDLSQTNEYSLEKDVQNFQGKGNVLNITSGEFYILNTYDGHKAGLHMRETNRIALRKLVFKIPV